MKRRQFLKTSVAASALTGLGAAQAALAAQGQSANAASRELYELRVYRLKPGARHDLLDAYLEKAAIPALNRLDAKPIGVFVEKAESAEPARFVLVPHASIDAFARTAVALPTDVEYQKAAAEYLSTSKANPAFDRIDSWLLLAFAGMPRLELAPYCRERKPRLFELRTYESHSESKALKKVEMFNSGEIDLMRQIGLAPVFYGQALAGSKLPHLTYMTSAENEDAHKKHWEAFSKHPTWDKLKNDPQYADTVSKITKWILVPTSYSQI